MASKQYDISYIKHELIIKDKWDNCIANAGNKLIYATSIYLDTMSKSWDALILNDYEAVMPLTYNKKYGVYYLYQPFNCASLGIFGNDLSREIIELFLEAIPSHFKYADIYLNYQNNFSQKNFKLTERINYVLPLNRPYEIIFHCYRNSYKQILIKNNRTNHLSVKRNIPYRFTIELASKTMKAIKPFVKDDIVRFKKLCSILLQHNQLKTYAVYENTSLLASAIFFIDADRIYYVMAGNTTEGKRKGASPILIDACIKDQSNTNMIFDFEGSNVPGIAFFFKGFAPNQEIYLSLKFNRLNNLLKIFKP